MLTSSINKQGLFFSVVNNNNEIPFSEWTNTDDRIYFFPLATLVDNGNATIEGNECLVPFDSIYLLDDTERMILGVPPMYEKAMRLRGLGMLNSPDFKYKLELLTYVPDGKLLNYETTGNIVHISDNQFLLSKEQYLLMNKISEFNNESEGCKTADYNLRCFSEIKELSRSCNCQLDSYLENENVFVPEKIKLDLGRDDSGFTINPTVDIEDNTRFTRAFDRMRRVQGVYPVQNENGERTRVVLSKEQQESLKPIKEHGSHYRSRDEVKDIIENPTEYFDPDQFDLSDFYSDRVIEIGVYKPKFYPFVSPYKSCWIAGAEIGTPCNGTTRITIDNEEELYELETAITDAEERKKYNVEFRDTQIDIEDAKSLADIARKQLSNPKEPVNKEGVKVEKKVLIIEENAEELTFSVDNKPLESENKYTLYKNPYLNPDYPLKKHQEEGVAWLQHLYKKNASGCLMADDMGLGKTLQILYFIDWHSRNFPNHNPYLIVAPVSLLENWENEYNKFFKTPRLSISRMTSRDVPRKFDRNAVDIMQSQDIILTNYESLRISQLNFCAVDFDIIALDEAQKIKSPGTMVTNASKALKGKFKIAMTGTPVENTLLDLWCIMDFCVPGLLGNAKAFASKYQTPLKNEDTDIVELGNEIHEKLGIYFMRRLKKDAAKDLPNKIELKEKVEMPALQKSTYNTVINDYLNGYQPNMLVTIMGIRTVSEHPYLYDETLSDHSLLELEESSARLQATSKFLDDIRVKREKVIIFAERKETQKMLQKIMYEKYGIVSKIINGDSPTLSSKRSNKQSRQESIDEFQTAKGFNVIIMSPVAAGMGLNVTAANHVIHYSRHWNPAKENQATDRAYRIGQSKDVYVYYPMAICEGIHTFDETLDELLTRKTSLATSTIFPTERAEVKQEELFNSLIAKLD